MKACSTSTCTGGAVYDTKTFTVSATKAPQSITFAALGNKTFGDPPFTVSAIGGGSGNPVTFSVGATGNCTSSGTNGSTITLRYGVYGPGDQAGSPSSTKRVRFKLQDGALAILDTVPTQEQRFKRSNG